MANVAKDFEGDFCPNFQTNDAAGFAANLCVPLS